MCSRWFAICAYKLGGETVYGREDELQTLPKVLPETRRCRVPMNYVVHDNVGFNNETCRDGKELCAIRCATRELARYYVVLVMPIWYSVALLQVENHRNNQC